jgi:sialate O-acetylesterase
MNTRRPPNKEVFLSKNTPFQSFFYKNEQFGRKIYFMTIGLKKILPALLLAAGAWPLGAQIRLAPLWGSHMVLQQQREQKMRGISAPGDTLFVRCSWLGNTPLRTVCDPQGRWEIRFQTPAGSLEPRQIRVSNGREQRLLEDVLIGELWLCSGQSNMEWEIRDSEYSPQQTRADQFPLIRQIKVEHAVALTPQDTLRTSAWQVCTRKSVQHFSAVAYFFARDLAERYRLPVGLINDCWGGSQLESWLSPEALRQSEQFSAYAQQFPADWARADEQALKKLKKYLFNDEKISPSPEQDALWQQDTAGFRAWKKIQPTLAWDWQDVWAFRGSGLMAHEVVLGQEAAALDATLSLGHGDLDTEIRINGQLLWKGRYSGRMELRVPAALLRAGTNWITYKQQLGKAKGWVEMGMRGPDADFYWISEDGKISLADAWYFRPLLSEPLYFVHSSNNLATGIYNAMIHPIAGFPLQGIIWYQGESNAGRAAAYAESFPLLIRDWRRIWGVETPFLWVQLANYKAGGGNSASGSEWAELREAQAAALQLPRTGMAVTIDVGDSNDIHPRNKHDVGARLAWEARRVVYKENILPACPPPPQVTFEKGQVLVRYADGVLPLQVRDTYGYIKGFEVAGPDQVFHYAQARIAGNQVIVQHPAVSQPIALRYAWADDPKEANLRSALDFPLPPFRTDQWPMRTQGKKFE